mgnify:CR=1 FL=1
MKKNIFVNLSNHPSQRWCQEQKEAVDKIVPDAQIMDYPFPSVDSSLNEAQILKLADQLADEIVVLEPSAVMCQGEFGLTFALVSILKKNGIKVVYSCSERKTTEHQTERGTEKISTFMFVKFREY